jgi:uncharacterized cofD-like protein
MKLRTLQVGCFGGGTGMPSLLGGLKTNAWIDLHAIVTMFDSGGSSGQLRDELGVLPPGDVLKCALALAQSEREARRILLSRMPALEHGRLSGHTGGNLLLSMMEQYTGDFLAAVEGLRGLLGCQGRVWPITIGRSTICAEYDGGQSTRGEVEVDRGQSDGGRIVNLSLDPPVRIHPAVDATIRSLDAVVIGPGSFYTSLLPIFLVEGCAEAVRAVDGPVIFVANLLTEGRGMSTFSAAEGIRLLSVAIGRPIDAVIWNNALPGEHVLDSYAQENKTPMPLGDVPSDCLVVEGAFWKASYARHHRRRLRAAVWATLTRLCF